MHMYKQAKGGKRKYYAERFKSQSAMEYLMTYGWAILIIAVILAALFELGVFNPYTFAAKAQPGSCQVYRPNGQGTNNFISLQGTCTNEIPEYAAQFNGNSYIQSNVTQMPSGAQQRTITAWYYATQTSSQVNVFSYGSTNCGPPEELFEIYIFASGTESPVMNAWCTDQMIGMGINSGWVFVTYEYNGTYQIGYDGINGNLYGPSSNAESYGTTPSSPFYIGGGEGRNPFVGYISNVQIYNTALSQSNIESLYKEGIGGVPIDLNSLVGWWPLNGNANDYSGNGNNGNAIGVTFTSGWYKGYSAP